MIDLSGVAGHIELFGFLLIFLITYALIAKTKVFGENQFLNLLISFTVAIMFVVVPPATKFITSAIPWVAVFFVVLALVLLTISFCGEIEKVMKPQMMVAVVIGLLLVLLVSAIHTFGYVFQPVGAVLTRPKVYTAVLLFVIAIIASFVLTRGGGGSGNKKSEKK